VGAGSTAKCVPHGSKRAAGLIAARLWRVRRLRDKGAKKNASYRRGGFGAPSGRACASAIARCFLSATMALIVALAHIPGPQEKYITVIYGAGVDVFFVISGFIIVYSARDLFGAAVAVSFSSADSLESCRYIGWPPVLRSLTTCMLAGNSSYHPRLGYQHVFFRVLRPSRSRSHRCRMNPQL
jgi:hypothetical protein